MKQNSIKITYKGKKIVLYRQENENYHISYESDRWKVNLSLLLNSNIRVMINKYVKKSEHTYSTQFYYDCYCTLSNGLFYLNDVSDPATCKRIINKVKRFTIEPILTEIYNQLKEEINSLHLFDIIQDHFYGLKYFIVKILDFRGNKEYHINNSLRFGIGENAYTTSEVALQVKEKRPVVLQNLFNGHHAISINSIIFFLYWLYDRDGHLTVFDGERTKCIMQQNEYRLCYIAESKLKPILSGVNQETTLHHNMFWNKLSQIDKSNIHIYWQYRIGNIELSKDDANSLLMEVICELTDIALEYEFCISIEDMCNEEGCFYEKYQDRFNSLYDEIENILISYDFNQGETIRP